MITPGQLRQIPRLDGPSTEYYRTHPEARARRVEKQAAINRRPEERKRRAALNRERRRRGIAGKGGPDISHTASGRTVLEDPSTNRGRNGAGGNPRLKRDSPWAEGFTGERTDAPERGKPCGASHIPKGNKCSKPPVSTTTSILPTAGKIALAAGAIAGGLFLAKKFREPYKPPVTRAEARERARIAAANPKLSPEDADRITREAIEGGQKWDVQEDINKRRQAEANALCRGDSLGKPLPLLRRDAWVQPNRCRAFGGGGAYGQYFVHPSEKYGIKANTDPDNSWIPEKEWEMLNEAHSMGIPVPEPLSLSSTGAITMRHMRGYKSVAKQFDNLYDAPLKAKLDVIRHISKLNTQGIAHGDAHEGNILWNPKTRKTALVDFGYATFIDDWSGSTPHGRSGAENLIWDMERLPERVWNMDDHLDLKRRQAFQLKWDEPLAFISVAAEEWGNGSGWEEWNAAQRAIQRYYLDLGREVARNEGYAPRVRSRLLTPSRRA